MRIFPVVKPMFSIDLKSAFKSIWLGWWLITWATGQDENDESQFPFWPLIDLDISYYPNGS